MRIINHILLACVPMLIIMNLTGCGAEANVSDTNSIPETGQSSVEIGARPEAEMAAAVPGRVYTITADFDDWRYPAKWVIGEDGSTIPEDRQFTVLRDILTGEPQCMMLSKTEGIGKDANGNILTRDVSVLFDLDGNVLYDWAECVYRAGFGDYIIRQNRWMMFYEETIPEDFKSELWNFKTGTSMIPDVGQIERISDEEALLMDSVYCPLGITDKAGNKRSGFPVPEQYARTFNAWNGYILAMSRPFMATDNLSPYQYFLLTPEFEPLLTHTYIGEGFAGDILRYIDGLESQDEKSGFVTSSGEELYQIAPGEYPLYFDEELAVIQYKEVIPDDGEHDSEADTERYRLIRISDGEVLGDSFKILSSKSDYETRKPSDRFLAYKDNVLQLIDRTGKALVRREMPGVRYLEYYSTGLYRVSLRTDKDENTDTILDMDLNEVIPPGIYNNILPTAAWSGDKYIYYDALTGERFEGKAMRRFVDVLDIEGNVMVDGLNQVFDVGPDRLAVRKGFTTGLMDWHGNWIVKRSIFSGLQND